MRAAVVTAFGSPPTPRDFDPPVAQPHESMLRVRAAGVHPLVKMLASGKHYGSDGALPFVVGVDCVGTTDAGTRVYGGFPRAPYGTIAEQVAVPTATCVPIPDDVDDAVAAAGANPGMSAWLALRWRGELAPGQTVLVLGATGVAGRAAVQLAKHLGAGKVIAAGRNARVLATLEALGADRTIGLDADRATLAARFRDAAGPEGLDVIVDYVWGAPAEAAIDAVTRRGLGHAAKRVRHVQVGESAGATITLPAGVLRGSALELVGTGAGTAPIATLMETIPTIFDLVRRGVLDFDVERVPLADVERAWSLAKDGRRIVIVP